MGCQNLNTICRVDHCTISITLYYLDVQWLYKRMYFAIKICREKGHDVYSLDSRFLTSGISLFFLLSLLIKLMW